VAAFVKLNWVTISAYCAASGISFNRFVAGDCWLPILSRSAVFYGG
jgi:hypothetical protein